MQVGSMSISSQTAVLFPGALRLKQDVLLREQMPPMDRQVVFKTVINRPDPLAERELAADLEFGGKEQRTVLAWSAWA